LRPPLSFTITHPLDPNGYSTAVPAVALYRALH
jgi:hypothetical protein